jgi:hypothetical protein
MAFVICLALTAAGLVAAWGRWRRKSPRAGVRMLAWAVLPMAFYLTGLADLAERIGSAFVKFGASFVFSPKTWIGVVLAGVAVLLLLVSGGLPSVSRRKAKAKAVKDGGSGEEPGRDGASQNRAKGPQALTVGTGKTRKRAAEDDDGMGDVEEILRRRGIS